MGGSNRCFPAPSRRSALRRGLGFAVAALVSLAVGGCDSGIPGPASAVEGSSTPHPFVAATLTSGCPSEACTALLAEVAAGAKTNNVPPDLAPSLQDEAGDMLRPTGGDCIQLPIAETREDWHPCVFTNDLPPTAPMLVLIGDSQAWMWAKTMRDVARQLGFRYGMAYHAACKMPDLTFNPGHGLTDAQCREWKEAAIDWMKTLNPTVVVVGSEISTGYSDHDYAAGYAAVLKRLQAPDRQLVVMGNPPVLDQDPPRCLAAHLTSALKCAMPPSKAAPAHQQQSASDAAAQGGANFVNMIPMTCTADLCPAIVGKYAVYQDRFHLSTTFTDHLAPLIQLALGIKQH